jgi:uncharacterized protein DUF6491
MIRWTIAGAMALAGCTASTEMPAGQSRADRDLAHELAGRTAGKPTDCISASSAEGPQIIDNKTILYRENGRTVWRNDLESGCPSLAPMNTLIVELHGGQICRHDRFRVLEPGANIPSAYCMMGKFTPYRK